MECRRYMAEKLPIRRKTLSNQSINQSINHINVKFIAMYSSTGPHN